MKIEQIKYGAYVKSFMLASGESDKVYFRALDMIKMNSEELYQSMMANISCDKELVKKISDLGKEFSSKRIYPDCDTYCMFMNKLNSLDSSVAKNFMRGGYPSNMKMLADAVKVYLEEPGKEDIDYPKDISDLAVCIYQLPVNEEMLNEVCVSCNELIDKLAI